MGLNNRSIEMIRQDVFWGETPLIQFAQIDIDELKKLLVSHSIEIEKISVVKFKHDNCTWQIIECGFKNARAMMSTRVSLAEGEPVYVSVSPKMLRMLNPWFWRRDFRLTCEISKILLSQGGELLDPGD